jgi:hypothetical protein
LTAQSLMGFMLSHWEIMKNENKCEAPSHNEQQLMVMRAEIEEMKQKKSVQGQQTNLMKKLVGRVSNKIKVARKVKQAGRYKGKFYQDDPEWLEKNIKPNPGIGARQPPVESERDAGEFTNQVNVEEQHPQHKEEGQQSILVARSNNNSI